MAISKVTLNGTVLMDVTQDTVVANKLMKNETAHKADGTQITGSYVAPTYTSQAKTGIVPTESSQTITPDSGYDGLSSVQINAISSTYVGSGIARRDSTSLTASGATVSVPAGYYASAASKAIASGSATTPATTITSAPTISVNAAGVVTASNSKTQSVTPTVSAGYVSTGTAGTITVSGSNTYELSTQAAKTVTPTESTQTAVAAGKYTTGAVTVGAISSTYIGSDIPRRGASDITDSGPFVTVPAGYYDMQYSQSVGFIAHADPSVSINSSTGLVTASHYQHYGYIESTGTTTKTLQLSTQGATTFTPTTTDQTIAAGKYTTGAQTIKGDANLVASNIAEGVTIFGVEGTFEGGIDVTITQEPDAHGGNVMKVESEDVFYQPVEWITSNNKIDLGFKTKNTMEFEAKFYRGDSTAQYLYLSDSGSALTTNTTAYLSSGGNWRFGNKAIALNPATGSAIVSIQNSTGVKFNGTSQGTYSSPGTFTSTANLGAFSSVTTSTLRIYYLKVKDNGNLIFDGIPAREVATNKLGFYDSVSGEFFTNDDATITAGSDVEDPIIRDGISKVEVFGMVAMDLTGDTVEAGKMLSGYTAHDASGQLITGTIATKTASDLTVSGATVTVPAGYYASQATKSVSNGSATTPATTITSQPTISVDSTTGVITASNSKTQSVTPTVSAGYVSSGTAGTITVSGSNTSNLSTQAGTTINPTESDQTAVAAGKYTLGAVKVGAISSTYVGSGIAQRSSTDLTASGATVSVPAGYYAEAASKAIASGSAATPATTITSQPTVSINGNGLITATNSKTQSVTPTVTAGYVESGTAGTITVKGSGTLQLTKRTSSNMTVSGRRVYAPAGYYPAQAYKDVGYGSSGTGSITIDPQEQRIAASQPIGAGYYNAQTFTVYKNINIIAGSSTTVTSQQTLVPADTYVTGDIVVIPGDPYDDGDVAEYGYNHNPSNLVGTGTAGFMII